MPCKSAKQCFLNQIHYLQVSIVVKMAFFLTFQYKGKSKILRSPPKRGFMTLTSGLTPN